MVCSLLNKGLKRMDHGLSIQEGSFHYSCKSLMKEVELHGPLSPGNGTNTLSVNSYMPFDFYFHVGLILFFSFQRGADLSRARSIHCVRRMLTLFGLFGICHTHSVSTKQYLLIYFITITFCCLHAVSMN